MFIGKWNKRSADEQQNAFETVDDIDSKAIIFLINYFNFLSLGSF